MDSESKKLLGFILAYAKEIHRVLSATNTLNSNPIVCGDTGSDVTLRMNPQLTFEEGSAYKLEVQSFSFLANVKNITEANNKLYLIKNGTVSTIAIPLGQYSFTDIFVYLTGLEPTMLFALNYNTEKIMMTLPATYSIVNTAADSILRCRFGFTMDTYVAGSFSSEGTPSISEVSAINICCDKIVPQTIYQSANMTMSTRSKVIWSVPYGNLDIGKVNKFDKAGTLYFPLEPNIRYLNELRFYLTDQDNRPIEANSEIFVNGQITQIRAGSSSV